LHEKSLARRGNFAIFGITLNLPIGPNKEGTMAWNTPKIVEISVGLEINSYVCAEL
jgi:coenzyme PQQ precursor peptide PqqA